MKYNFMIEKKENLSIFAAGYIITESGECILIGDNEYHSIVFSEFISVIDNSDYFEYNLFEASKILLENGNILYFGIKPAQVIKYDSTVNPNIVLNDELEVTDSQLEIINILCEKHKKFDKDCIENISFDTINSHTFDNIDSLRENLKIKKKDNISY